MNVVLGVFIVGPRGILIGVKQRCHINQSASQSAFEWALDVIPRTQRLPPLLYCGDDHLALNRQLVSA